MAYMEVGNSRAAKRHLVRVMQLQPQDAQAHLIMGNIYLQQENDLGSAERYYQTAYDLDPNDLYLLNGFGVLKAKRNQFDEAKDLFTRAIDIDPNFPNARYGLALTHQHLGEPDRALNTLQELFALAPSSDPRQQVVYSEARKLFFEVNQQLAEEQSDEIMAKVRADIESYSKTSPYPIRLEEDSSIEYAATAQIAWLHRRPQHLIKYKATRPGILPHLIAHEFEHISMIEAAVRVNRNRFFTTTHETVEYARRSMANEIRKFKPAGMDERAASEHLDWLIKGLSNQLFNTPLDMIIEYRLHEQRPYLAPSQVSSLYVMLEEGVQTLNPSFQQMIPRRIWQASITLNCAYAHFADHLLDHTTSYAEAYRSSGQYHNGEKLFQLWQRQMASYQPGDEYDLVDLFAKDLKLERWYKWREDLTAERDLQPIDAALEKTQKEQLQQKESAAVIYCLDALRQFEGLDRQQILAIVSEIAFLGRAGLNYRSSEQTYTLRALPGAYSGLHLMCLMYVGFQHIDPTVDIGIDLTDAYSTARALYSGA